MKKITLLKSLFVAVMLSFFSFSVVAEETLAYTISFENTKTTDGSTALTTSNFVNAIIEGQEYVASCTETAKCYEGKEALKLGSSSDKGYFTLSLSDDGQVNATKVVLYTTKWKDTDGDDFICTINGTSSTLKISDVNTVDVNAKIETIKIEASKASKNRFYIAKIEVYKDAAGVVEPTVARPTTTVNGGEKFEAFDVEIACATEGAVVYYALNGGEEVEYTTATALNIATTTELKAWAKLGEEVSDTLVVNYTFPTEVADIAALLADETGENVRIAATLTVVAQTGNYLWVTDGTTPMLVYGYNNPTLTAGDQLTGLVGKASTYSGAKQIAPAYFPTAVVGTAVEPTTMALADVTASTVHTYIKLEGVTYTNATTLTDGENTLAMYDRFKYTYAGEEGDKVDVIAIAGLYNTTVQIYPISIEKVVEPEPITATWNIEEGAVLESFESATITFTGVEAAKAKATYSNFIFYSVDAEGNATLCADSYCQPGYMDTEASGTAVTFSLDFECYQPLKAGNKYRIVVPVGAIKFNNDNANLNTEEYVLNFTMAGEAAPELSEIDAVFTANPENNSTVAEIREIVLTFTEYETITVAEPDLMTGSNIPTVSMGYEGMFMPSGMFMMFAAGETANTLKLYVDPRYAGGMEAFTTEGEYKIVIPEGVVTFGEAGLNKTIELNYTVAEPAPEVVPTIVGGTKLYLKSDLGVSSSSAYGYNVVFGEFEVPSSGGSGGSVRPMQQAGSLGGTTTIPGTAMTKVYTKEGKYDIWEVVAPEGTADSIFNIVVSRKGTMISGYITPLKYDGEHNMFMLPEKFAFDLRTPIADETAGEWGIYVEGEYSDPDPIVGTWNIEEGAVLESFESATLTFTGVESAAAKSSYTNYFFYKVAEDGTETLVPSMCSDGYMDAAEEGTSVTFSIDKETCYLDMPQYGAYFALTSGDYRIKVPAGAIKFNGDATNLNTEAYVLNFSLNVPAAAEPVEAVYTVDPENNSTVAEIREIVLTFTEYETITVAEPDLMMGSNIPTVSMGNEGMFMPSGMFMMFAAGETANTLKLYVDPQYAGGMEAFTTEGEYKIVIPEGVVTFGEAGLNKTIELNYTVEEPQPIEVTITGKVKRAVQTGTASIVLTHEEDGTAHIYSVDNETLAITELSQEGVIARDAENAGDYLALSDIALTTDGKLVACNYVQTQHNADNVKDGYKRGMANFYIWNDLAGAPSIWFQSKAASNSLTSDQGYTMAVQGTSTDAQILVSGLRAEGSMRYSLFKVVNGVYEDINQDAGKTTNDYYFYFGIIKDGANFKVSTHGEDYQFTASPLNSANFVYDGNLAEPSEISVPTSTTENPVVEGVIAEGTFGKKFNGVSYLTVDEQVLMAAPFANEEGLLEGVRVLDITKGFAEATMFETTALLETAVAVESAAVTFVEGTEGYVDLYLFAGSEIYTFEQKVEKEQQNPVDVENGELVVDVYSENGSVYVEVEAGVMVEAYTVDGLCVYSEVSKSATTVIEGLNTNMAIIRVNGVAYKVFVK